jgi:hypothetical protein
MAKLAEVHEQLDRGGAKKWQWAPFHDLTATTLSLYSELQNPD